MRCDADFVFLINLGWAVPRAVKAIARTCCLLAACSAMGCGTTRTSDTLRTGTEQLLLSTAIERAINDMDFSILEGRDVYFDPQYLKGVADEGYIISSLRQRLLAEGVLLKSNRDDATYVVEARAGAVGTNHQDVLVGVPQVSLPSGGLMTGVPSAIPEIPLAKKTQQKGVVKLAAFAYNQKSGQAVWQSGTFPITADARDTWFLGTGPFQRGSIYPGTNFAGQRVGWFGRRRAPSMPRELAPGLSVTAAASFAEDPRLLASIPAKPEPTVTTAEASDVKKEKPKAASFTPAVPPSQPQPGRIPTTDPASSTSSTPTSGFSPSAFSNSVTQDPKASSGGNAAAAGLMILRKQAADSQR